MDGFTKYDTSYELQSMQLMIEILKPYILFKKSIQEKDIQIYQIVEDKEEHKLLTMEEYIHFIQIIFPNIIHGEIEELLERNRIETVRKEVFDSRRRNGGFKLPLFLEECDRSLYEFYMDEFNQKDKEGISELRDYYTGPQYDEITQIRNDKYTYLENIKKFNRKMNGKIQDVIQFISNLKYYL